MIYFSALLIGSKSFFLLKKKKNFSFPFYKEKKRNFDFIGQRLINKQTFIKQNKKEGFRKQSIGGDMINPKLKGRVTKQIDL